jgi:hypothetical protein
MTNRMLVALDVATNMGVVYKQHPGGKFMCTTYKGTPIEQVEMLLDVLGDDLTGCTVFVEQLNDFINANTVRSLLKRVGYIENSLIMRGAKVEYFNAMSARKYIGAKKKADVHAMFSKYGLDPDQSDALAIMCFAMDYSPTLIMEEDVVCLTKE